MWGVTSPALVPRGSCARGTTGVDWLWAAIQIRRAGLAWLRTLAIQWSRAGSCQAGRSALTLSRGARPRGSTRSLGAGLRSVKGDRGTLRPSGDTSGGWLARPTHPCTPVKGRSAGTYPSANRALGALPAPLATLDGAPLRGHAPIIGGLGRPPLMPLWEQAQRGRARYL